MSKFIKYVIANLIFTTYKTISFAAVEGVELTKEAPTLKGSPVLTLGYVFQVFISLLVVIGLIYVVARFLLPKLQMPSRGRLIQIVDRIGLEPQVSAYILKVKDKSWLIVTSKGSVEVVDKVDLEEKSTESGDKES